MVVTPRGSFTSVLLQVLWNFLALTFHLISVSSTCLFLPLCHLPSIPAKYISAPQGPCSWHYSKGKWFSNCCLFFEALRTPVFFFVVVNVLLHPEDTENGYRWNCSGDTEGGHSAACLSPKQPCARGWFAAVRGTASDIPRVKCTLEAAGTQGGAASGWVSLSQARTPGWPMKIPGERVCVPDTA